jgi:8-oxo-dGTP pyrophosphatase MutT (NUDIX family)
LVLHRAHNGPEFEGDWAWTPPAGARFPGEEVQARAVRELEEETGLKGDPIALVIEDIEWAVFDLVVPWGVDISLDGEHDRCEWLALDDACARCLPTVVAESLRLPASSSSGSEGLGLYP